MLEAELKSLYKKSPSLFKCSGCPEQPWFAHTIIDNTPKVFVAGKKDMLWPKKNTVYSQKYGYIRSADIVSDIDLSFSNPRDIYGKFYKGLFSNDYSLIDADSFVTEWFPFSRSPVNMRPCNSEAEYEQLYAFQPMYYLKGSNRVGKNFFLITTDGRIAVENSSRLPNDNLVLVSEKLKLYRANSNIPTTPRRVNKALLAHNADIMQSDKVPFKRDKTDGSDKLFLGLELEAQVRKAHRSKFEEVIGMINASAYGKDIILKHDGSTGAGGFELVTIPAGLEYHKKTLVKDFFKDTGKAYTLLQGHESCGIHVHTSRNQWSRMQIGKLFTFFGSVANKDFIYKFAGRQPNRYCQERNNAYNNLAKSCLVHLKKYDRGDYSYKREYRYFAINVVPRHTLEFRLFKSSTNYRNILRKMEFCHAMHGFTSRANVYQMTYQNFIKYVFLYRKKYKYLIKWLGVHGYVDMTLKTIEGKKHQIRSYKLLTKDSTKCV